MNELVTNAAKHAFSDGNGEIQVELSRAGQFVECKVLDNGSALEHARSGRGLRIINELSRALEGRFELRFGDRGSAAVLIFPETSQSR